MGKARLTTEEVRNEMWDLVGDEYTVLSEYVNATTPIIVRHNKCKREYPVRWNNFKHGKRCALCKGVLKYTIEEAREAFDKLNLTLLTEEYTSSLTPMDYICRIHPEEGVQKGTLSAILGGHVSCKKCRYKKTANSSKTDFSKVKEKFEDLGLDLLDEEYVNCKEPMHFICRKHLEEGIQITTYASLQQGSHGCDRCGYESMGDQKRMSDEDIIKLFDDNGFDVVEIIKERKTKVKCICRKHRDKGIQIKSLNSLKIQGKGCKYCAGNMKLTQEEVEKRIFNKNKNLVVTSQYINEDTDISLHCKICGYSWSTRAANVTSTKSNCNCPNCSGSLGERRVWEFLIDRNIYNKREFEFDDLFGYKDKHLRFDFALFDDECCKVPYCLIEFDGQHHYEPTDYCGEGIEKATRRHKNTVKYDKKKNKYCLDNNLKLIRIPYWEFDNIENILEKELNLIKYE